MFPCLDYGPVLYAFIAEALELGAYNYPRPVPEFPKSVAAIAVLGTK